MLKFKGMLLCMLVLTSIAFAAWDEPAGGWDMEYSAANDGEPNATDGWAVTNGSTGSIINDSILGTDVLKIVTRDPSKPKYAHDLDVTSDVNSFVGEFKVRMPYQVAKGQFRYLLKLGKGATTSRYWYFSLWNSNSGEGSIASQYSNTAVREVVACSDIDLDWHTVRVVVSDMSVDVPVMDIYIDDSNTLVASFASLLSGTYGNAMTVHQDVWCIEGDDTRIDYIKYAVNRDMPELIADPESEWNREYDPAVDGLPSAINGWSISYNDDNWRGTGTATVANGILTLNNGDNLEDGSEVVSDTLDPSTDPDPYGKATVQFKFRLADANQSDGTSQFQVCAYLKNAEDVMKKFSFRLSRDRVRYFDTSISGSTQSAFYDFGDDWHTGTLFLNANTETASFYLGVDPNECVAVAYGAQTSTAVTDEKIYFGDDATTDVAGIVELEYFRYKLGVIDIDDYPIMTHSGSTDPVYEGWQGQSSTAFYVGAGGVEPNDYWYVNDAGSDSGQSVFYQTEAAAMTTGMFATDWTATATVFIESSNKVPDCMFGAFFKVSDDERYSYSLVFVKNSDPETSGVYMGTKYSYNYILIHNLDVTVPHTYQMYYDFTIDNGLGGVEVYIDGHLFKTVSRDYLAQKTAVDMRLSFGSASSIAQAKSCWNYVQFGTGKGIVSDTYAFTTADVKFLQTADFDGNCMVDEYDLVDFTDSWLDSGTQPTADISLTGVSLHVENITMLEDSTEHLNFPKVSCAGDGVLWEAHSVGEHMTNAERGQRMISYDAGETWSLTPKMFLAYNTIILDNGKIVEDYCSNSTAGTSASMITRYWADDAESYERFDSTLALPYSTTVQFYDSLVVAADGSWIQSAAGFRDGETSKSHAMFFKSTDQGQSWSFLSNIDYDTTVSGSFTDYGVSEATLAVGANGNLICLMRTDAWDNGPLYQAISTNNGVSWSTPAVMPNSTGGTNPTMKALENGGLVVSYGRRYDSLDPEVWFAIDLTGTGSSWQAVSMFSGNTSANSSIVEVQADKLVLAYDISGFMDNDLSSSELPNKLVCDKIDLVFNDSSAACGERGNTDYSEKDYNKDCIVNLEDFVYLAEDWLVSLLPDSSSQN